MILPELKLDEGKNRRKLPHKASLTNPASSGKWGSWTTWSDKTTWGLKSPGMGSVFFGNNGEFQQQDWYVFNGFQARRFGEIVFFWGGLGPRSERFFFFSLGHNLVWDPWVSFLYIWNASLPQCQANASSAGILRGEVKRGFCRTPSNSSSSCWKPNRFWVDHISNVNDGLLFKHIIFCNDERFSVLPKSKYIYIYIYYNIN